MGMYLRMLGRVPGRRHDGLSDAARRQRGMASILITLITMIVISLIVLGFAAISRREQRQSLDQQLSTQAFYAAESAVEDAKQIIETRLASGQQLIGKNDCARDDQNGGYPEGNAMTLDAPNSVSFTCLKVDLAPGDLQYDGVTDNNIIVPIRTAGPLNRLEITWQPNPAPGGNPQAACPAGTANVFSSQTNWNCGFGLLRLDLVSIDGAIIGGTGAGSLMSNNLAAYFVPTNAAASGQLSFAASLNRPNVVAANCNNTNCTADITNLNGGSREYALRLSSIYRGSNIRIAAFSGGSPTPILGAQVVVDATGKAQDVMRRVQVRLPITNRGDAPSGFAIQSNGSICKRFATAPGYFAVPADIVDADNGNSMCQAQTDGAAPGNATPPPPPPGPGLCAVPNDITFALDASASMLSGWGSGNRAQALQRVTRQFIGDTSIATAANNAAIIAFNARATLEQRLTGDQGQLISAVNGLDNETGTNYMEALRLARAEIASVRRPNATQVMIFISDGAPTDQNGDSDDSAERDAIRVEAGRVKAAGIRLYTVAIGDPNDTTNPLDKDLLRDMAGNGGTFADASSSAQLQNIMDQLSSDLTCN